jgi:MinD-like ATPase involved in chromosome partitioning or flagellar assembly
MMGAATHQNGRPPRSGAPPTAAIGMVGDEATRALLTRTATDRGIACGFELGSIEDALERLAPDEPADCIVIDITDALSAIDEVAILASHLPATTRLVLLGQFSSADHAELRAAGASLCIDKEMLKDQLDAIFGIPLRRDLADKASVLISTAENPTSNVVATIGQPAIEVARVFIESGTETGPETPPLRLEGAPSDMRPAKAAQAASLSAHDRVVAGAPPLEHRSASDRPRNDPHPAAGQTPDWQQAPPSYREPPAAPVRRVGRVVVVLGCRGGVGTTSIAVGLAWLLSEENALNTALLDLDAHFGSVALALNLDPGEGLPQALEQPGRVDGLFVERAVRKVGPKLFVLSSERALDTPLRGDPTGPASLVRALSQRHERVVVDLPRSDPQTMPKVLALADEIVLVTDLSLAGARDAVRLMALVRKATSYARVRVVGGGARDNGKNSALTPSEFRKAAGLVFEMAMAHDPEAANEAARSGRPIPKVAPRSALSKTLRSLAQALEPSEQRERKRRLLFWKH